MLSFNKTSKLEIKLPHELRNEDYLQDKVHLQLMSSGVNFYSAGSDYLVFLGFRSGLEFLTAVDTFKSGKFIIIEDDEKKLSILDFILKNEVSLKQQVSVFSEPKSSSIIELLSKATVSVRVDARFLTVDTLEHICEHWTVEHICGEINTLRLDTLDIHRVCRTQVDTFFWTLSDNDKPLTGKRSPYAVDVSIVVPVYNISAYVDKCIFSLVSQTLESIEILIIDDGSTDNSVAVSEKWQQQYPNKVRVIRKQNGGCASARNLGIMSATGNYIGFVDGDDWVEPDMFNDLLRSAIADNAQIAQCGYQEVYEAGEITTFPLDTQLSRLDLLHQRPTIWRRIYAKDFLMQAKIFFPENIKRFDDLPFQFDAFFNASAISAIPNCYYNYRQGRIGQDISIKDERLYVHFDIFSQVFSKYGELLNYDEEKSFFELELDVHHWALSIINDSLKKEYASKAVMQILRFRSFLSLIQMLKISKRKRKFIFFTSLLLKNKVSR
ncbi:glycosyltransferase involved in cell wall biosynthesis [Rahnella sp. BIGb0236]|uniref:glycosyltransferase n=1 Tax=Rahnella sp. BIGb0236 TaxID=2485117 RepID=UPI00105B6ECF|nr:glycosyltransferase [Rahnella sp. BIGb0236]TDS84879.1 glycosyltransferase involved in cell wall biosynthesis [Rahnella sp. BIGb0236]